MKIGILGGTFDPPHEGHLRIARAAREALELDEVIFVPAHRNPLKGRAPGASAQQRLEMTRLAIKDEDGFALSDQEVNRRGQSYTIDTLDELQAVRPAQYWLIMGLDAAVDFKEWRAWNRILKIARLAVFQRGGGDSDVALARVPSDLHSSIDFIRFEPFDVSSTDLRYRIGQGAAIHGLVPKSVLDYIKKNNLYK